MAQEIRRRDWKIVPVPMQEQMRPYDWSESGNDCWGKCKAGTVAEFYVYFTYGIHDRRQFCAECLKTLANDMLRAIGPEHVTTTL